MNTNKSARLRESIRQLERKLGVLEEDRFSCCGLASLAQCHALVEIGRAESLSLIELAAILALDTSTMSRTVDKLVKAKLVQREADENDRRYIRIHLTSEGKKLFSFIEEEMAAYFAKVLSDIPFEKRDMVVESLELLCSVIDIEGGYNRERASQCQ